MGDDRAETYLRLAAEAEFRRLQRTQGAVMSWPDIAGCVGRIQWAGDVLVAAGLLAGDHVSRIANELQAALAARASAESPRRAARLGRAIELTETGPQGVPPRSRDPARPMQVTPIGRTLRVAGERAPSALWLMTLVRTPPDAAITVTMRMLWPPDGSCADLEITGAGPQHFPYDQLWAVDDQGARYRLQLAGEGGTAIWHGTAELSQAPPPDARWLDLIADGTRRLIRLDLKADGPAARVTTGRDPAAAPGERLLAMQAERILATAGANADPRLGEVITVLASAGAIAADSPTPGHLAALCQRLGVQGHGITAPAAAVSASAASASAASAAGLPVAWASVLAGLDAEPAGAGPEWYVPLGVILADVDGTRFALGGLTSAAGESHLHIVASGVPLPLPGGWGSGFSWWIGDDGGRWHVGDESDPCERSPGQTAFRLRLTPPLDARPGAIEVVVAGQVTRVRAVVPVRGASAMPDT